MIILLKDHLDKNEYYSRPTAKMWRTGAVPPRRHTVRRGQGKCRSATLEAVKPQTSCQTSSAAINQILIAVVLEITLTVRVVSDSRIKLSTRPPGGITAA